jgi:hypothetical protein
MISLSFKTISENFKYVIYLISGNSCLVALLSKFSIISSHYVMADGSNEPY